MHGLLVFGRNGQLARALSRHAPQARFLNRNDADLTDPSHCAAAIRHLAPRAVINAAAYTAVDRAETDRATAHVVNCDAPRAMAEAAAKTGIPFLHVSTDYVFDGKAGAPRQETDATNPLGEYGRSKLAGEAAVGGFGAVVVRTSWVFSGDGHNFVKTMLALGCRTDRLSVVSDQMGGPVPADDLACALLRIAQHMQQAPAPHGLYHFSGTPDVSRADFAREIFSRAGLSCQVDDVASATFPTAAERPLDARLDCSRIAHDFGIERPDWRQVLDRMLTPREDAR